MNTKNLFLIVAAVVLMAAGCRTTPKSVLTAEPTSLNFTVAGGEKTFDVTSNVRWTITGQSDWIDLVEPSSGSGTDIKVTVKVKANTTTGKRDVTLYIKATDVPDIPVTVFQDAPTTVSIAAIGGVTAPVAGATPASAAITETEQYTGAVKWETADATFAARKAYTATITLTAKAGFMFAGVAENFFTVEGATAINPAGSGVITAAFPTIPDGTVNYPFLVATVADLQKVGKEGNWTLNRHYRQTANIDMSGVDDWTPIGNASNPGESSRQFTGSYDGGGYSIANFIIPLATTAYKGLFGFIGKDGTVRNVALRDVSINSTNVEVGAIVGENQGTIENCYVTGEVNGRMSVGGAAGYNAGVIKNCYTTCDVTSSSGTGTGGIVGSNSHVATQIANCYATGKISGTDFVGGIVGNINNSSNGTFERCVALNSEVSASDGTNVGRIAGINYGILNLNYARESDMTLTNSSGSVSVGYSSSLTSIHGGHVTATQTHGASSGTWWSGTLGWSSDYWDFAINRLPHLKTTTGEAFKEDQDPEVK